MTEFAFQARYIRRGFDRFMGLIDTGSAYEPVLRPDPGSDGRLKLLGTYRMPRWGGFNLSGIYRHTTGQAYNRSG